MKFLLRHMPRRGKETTRSGIMYGPFLGSGIVRLHLLPESSNNESLDFLLENGLEPKFWIRDHVNSKTERITIENSINPLIEGMNQTAFDLLMPFVFWDGVYLKSGKVAGRPAHLFSFRIPDWVNHIKPNLTEIVMALDKSYEAPLRVETYENRNVPSKTYILNSVKKVEDNWIVKSIDCKNRLDRSATRFEVLSAAFNLDLDLSLFSVGGLMNRPTVSVDSFISTQ